MNEAADGNEFEARVTPRPDEEFLLESALCGSDNLLRASLREEDRRRRWRRLYVFTLIGGIVMTMAVIAALAGFLTLATPPPAQGEVDRDEWVSRLVSLRDHMHTAFGVGPDLTLLDPDEGLAIVRKAWPKLTSVDVKTGLLKTFAFSKALPNKHPKVLQVLDLGMRDKNPKVQAYAAAYVEEYAGEDFAKNSKGYAVWYKANRDKDPNELLKSNEGSAADVANAPSKTNAGDAVDQGEALSQEGWRLWQSQQFADAAAKFEEAVALDAENANSWNGLGWAQFNSGDTDNAIAAFEKCVAIEPNHPAGLNGLGQAYLSQGNYELAEKFLVKAAPNAPAAWYGLARLYLLTGKFDEAEKWIKKALASQPDDPDLKTMLAAAKKGELPNDLRRQIEPAKRDDSPAGKLAIEGWQQFNSGRTRSAEQSFKKALAKDPENLSAMNGLGFLLLNSGKAAEAKGYFEKCLAAEPDAAGPMNGLARALKSEGKVDEAIALWEKMHEKYPGPNAAAVGLATTYLERKEFSKAEPFFAELVKAQPDSEEFKKGLEAAQKGAAEKQ
jgi:tetratricopeptide (TPR) repeat protein